MKIVSIAKPGSFARLRVVDAPAPKLGPGEYKPDIAFKRTEDLPRPKLITQRRDYAQRDCPR